MAVVLEEVNWLQNKKFGLIRQTDVNGDVQNQSKTVKKNTYKMYNYYFNLQ